MGTEKKNRHTGLATLFDGVELKSFFINYLWFIIAVEILIFLVSFLGNLGPDKGPFPWKFYFYVSFITPVAITFLLGVFILAFNQFIFGDKEVSGEDDGQSEQTDDNRSKLFRLNLFLTHMKKVPFLPVLFALVACGVLFYKLDAIFLFLFNAGEKMVTYVLIACGALLVAGLIFGIAWIISNYRLSKRHMEHQYRYRNDVMDKLGFLIMDDDTVIDKDGKLISQKQQLLPESHQTSKERETLKIMPPSK